MKNKLGLSLLVCSMILLIFTSCPPITAQNSHEELLSGSILDPDLGPIQIGEIETTSLGIRYRNRTGWTQTIHYPGAAYIKVHFFKLDLLAGDHVTVSDPAGVEVYTYPNVSGYTTDEGEGFWAISVAGDTAVIELLARQLAGSHH